MASPISLVKEHILTGIANSEGQMIPFGIIMTINYPLYHFIWTNVTSFHYENFTLRLFASLFCIPLIFKKYWPSKLKKCLPIYWYSVVLFVLPFFFTFMTLKNHASVIWLMNCISVLFFLMLLFDFLNFVMLTVLGFILGWFAYRLTITTPFVFMPGTIQAGGVLATFAASLVIGGVFARNREIIEAAKLQTMRSIGASMAHELRTPLRAISSGVGGMKYYLPALLDGYQKAKNAQLEVAFIEPATFHLLQTMLDDVESEARASFNVIDMLLINASLSHIDSSNFKLYSIVDCVDEALRRYAFDVGQEALIHWNNSQDFTFHGDKLLITHVLFNSLKNAIYYVRDAGKGQIDIWCEKSEQMNYLYFRDTGKGIPKKVLPHIFDQFFTRTRHGSGLGLTFCKTVMRSFGGDIECQSEEGKFTLFTLSFPLAS